MSGVYLFDEYLKYEVTIRGEYCKIMEKKMVTVEKKREKKWNCLWDRVCVQ